MSRLSRALDALHLAILGLWLGALAVTGVAAALIFPIMKNKVAPTLPDYASYTGEHWLIAAGHIARPTFSASFILQGLCAIFAVATLLPRLIARSEARAGGPNAQRIARRAALIRSIPLLIAIILLAVILGWLQPAMNTALDTYWAAAKAGDNATALTWKARFDELHPTSRQLLSGTAIALIAAIFAAAFYRPVLVTTTTTITGRLA